MMMKGIPTHDGSKFSWKGDHGYAEASDLLPGPLFSQVWDDACDEGFFVVSPKTGRRVLFTVTNFVHDGSGDLVRWFFKNHALNGGDVASGTLEITIFND